jgi:hypothetical protein
MQFNKYAFATEIEEGSNLFEVFYISVFESDSDIAKRWKIGTSDGKAIVLNVTDYVKNNKITFGSVWDGNKFILPAVQDNSEMLKGLDTLDPWVYESGSLFFALISNNKVFGRSIEHLNIEMWDAATSNKVILLDLTDIKPFGVGYVWDGSTLTPPTE